MCRSRRAICPHYFFTSYVLTRQPCHTRQCVFRWALSTAYGFKALSALPTDPVLFLDTRTKTLDLAETASHRLNAARRLLEVTTIYKIPEADSSALSAVSEAVYLLLSDGCDLFNAVAFGREA